MATFEAKVTGDFRGVLSLPKQMRFAASLALTRTAGKSQDAVIEHLDDDMNIRKEWYQPGRKFGIKFKPAKTGNLEATVYSAADWLMEMHGFNNQIKQPDKGGSNLAVPDTDNVRGRIENVVPRAKKARRLLENTQRTKAFKITSKKGIQLILQRIGADKDGNDRVSKSGAVLKAKKGGPSKVRLLYTLRPSVKVPYNPVLHKWTIMTYRQRFGASFGDALEKALKTAK